MRKHQAPTATEIRIRDLAWKGLDDVDICRLTGATQREVETAMLKAYPFPRPQFKDAPIRSYDPEIVAGIEQERAERLAQNARLEAFSTDSLLFKPIKVQS